MQAEIYIRLLKTENVNQKYVNIMTQYNNQCHVIKELLDSKGYINANINTVVKSQGTGLSIYICIEQAEMGFF